MVTKLKYILLSVLLIFFLSSNSVSAQLDTTDYDAAYKQYSLTLEEYQRVHSEYQFAKGQYQQFKTLKSQSDAIEATIKMLSKRDEVVVNYSSVLEERLKISPGVTVAELNNLISKLQTEKEWFTNHSRQVTTAATFQDLVRDSNSAKDRYESAKFIFYEVLSSISIGKVDDYHKRLLVVFSSLNDKVLEFKGESFEEGTGLEKSQRIDRWIFESESRIERSEVGLTEAKGARQNFLPDAPRRTNNPPRLYQYIIDSLHQSRLYLNEASSFMKEIVREIKTE
jgi:hypothetical protein